MNEEKYTRNSAKKSTRKKKVNPDIHAGKSHGKKLKNDSSAARSYRDKIQRDVPTGVSNPAKVQFEHLAKVHSGRHTQRVQHDEIGRAHV